MIKNKNDLRHYLDQDRKALGINKKRGLKKYLFHLFFDEIWKFEKTLRFTEYYSNICDSNFLFKCWRLLLLLFYKYNFRKISIKLGFSIPINVFGPGLSIAHRGTIVVNPNARIGANCRLHACVNIGTSSGGKGAPHVGDNVYIGPGAILFGGINIANNVSIGANATVNRNCEKERCILAGTPAIVVKEDTCNWIEFNRVEELQSQVIGTDGSIRFDENKNFPHNKGI